MNVVIYITHCSVCNRPMEASPGLINAEVTHLDCAMEASREARERDVSAKPA